MPRMSMTPSADDDLDDIPASIQPTQAEEVSDAGEQLEHELMETTEQMSPKKEKKPRKQKTEKAVKPEPAPKESLNGDAEEGEELYEVEKVVGHKFKGKQLLYRVRWKGYSAEEDTFEPEDHLLPASKQLLAQYHKAQGGTPQPSKQVRKSTSKANLKHETSAVAAEEDHNGAPPAKRTKRAHKTGPDPESIEWKDEPAGAWLPTDKGSWEDLIHEVETVERDENGNIEAFIRFRNGKRSRVSHNLYISRCPRAMVKFYEKHLSV